MSQRELQVPGSLQQWRGVDQRTQPTLVQDGFFIMSRGVFFGYGDNCERLPGKKLAGVLAGPVFNLWQFGSMAFVQTMDTLYMVPISELFDFDILPAVPDDSIQDEDDGDVLDEDDGFVEADS